MYLKLSWTFFKIAIMTFGGGYAMIPFIHRYAVEKYKWISEDEFLEIVAIAESTPGPIAVNSATFVGHKVKGVRGSLAANLGLMLPSMIIIITIAIFFMQYKDNPHVEYAFKGIRIGVSILVINAALRIYKKIDKHWISYGLILLGFILLLFDILSVVFVILIGGTIGIISYIYKIRGEENVDS
jgi:chromate transporter